MNEESGTARAAKSTDELATSPSRTRRAIAALTDGAPLVLVVSVAKANAETFRHGNWFGSCDSTPELCLGVAAAIFAVMLVAHASPLTPRDATVGDWFAGLRAGPAVDSPTTVRWLGRAIVGLLSFAFVLDLRSVWALALGVVILLAIVLARLVQFVRDAWAPARARSASLVDHRDVFDEGLSPERALARLVVTTAALGMATYLARALVGGVAVHAYLHPVRVLHAWLVGWAYFATLALLTAGRARALADDRAFPISDLHLVVGFVPTPYAVFHAFRVAAFFIDAYPESRLRVNRTQPSVAAMAKLAACGVATYSGWVSYALLCQFSAAPEPSGGLVRAFLTFTALGTSLPFALVLMRVREVLAMRPSMRRVKEAFE